MDGVKQAGRKNVRPVQQGCFESLAKLRLCRQLLERLSRCFAAVQKRQEPLIACESAQGFVVTRKPWIHNQVSNFSGEAMRALLYFAVPDERTSHALGKQDKQKVLLFCFRQRFAKRKRNRGRIVADL